MEGGKLPRPYLPRVSPAATRCGMRLAPPPHPWGWELRWGGGDHTCFRAGPTQGSSGGWGLPCSLASAQVASDSRAAPSQASSAGKHRSGSSLPPLLCEMGEADLEVLRGFGLVLSFGPDVPRGPHWLCHTFLTVRLHWSPMNGRERGLPNLQPAGGGGASGFYNFG